MWHFRDLEFSPGSPTNASVAWRKSSIHLTLCVLILKVKDIGLDHVNGTSQGQPLTLKNAQGTKEKYEKP